MKSIPVQMIKPKAVGRVTPCAPRRQPAGAKSPRRRLPDPPPMKTLLRVAADDVLMGDHDMLQGDRKNCAPSMPGVTDRKVTWVGRPGIFGKAAWLSPFSSPERAQ